MFRSHYPHNATYICAQKKTVSLPGDHAMRRNIKQMCVYSIIQLQWWNHRGPWFTSPCPPVPCYHWWQCLPGGCCICLEQSAGVSSSIAVTQFSAVDWRLSVLLDLLLQHTLGSTSFLLISSAFWFAIRIDSIRLHGVYTGRSLPQPVGATGPSDRRSNRLRRRSPRVNATGNWSPRRWLLENRFELSRFPKNRTVRFHHICWNVYAMFANSVCSYSYCHYTLSIIS